MSTRVVGTDAYEDLVDALIAQELPGLPRDRRDAAVGFAARRLQQMASPIRVALQAVAVASVFPQRIIGTDTIVRWLRHTHLPFASDVPRAMRYLVVAYVWETWPDTQPDGSPGAPAPQDATEVTSDPTALDQPTLGSHPPDRSALNPAGGV